MFSPLTLTAMWLRVNGPEAVATSLALSVGFVGVLYLVPPRVRKLARNDPEHVRVLRVELVLKRDVAG